MTKLSHEASASRLPNFEEAYLRYPCSDRTEFKATLLIAALLCPAELIAGERTHGMSAAFTVDGPHAASSLVFMGQRGIHRFLPSARRGPPLFFGYVEFDIDPDTAHGVPGFGPLPNPAARASR